jgi:hypothetical protein
LKQTLPHIMVPHLQSIPMALLQRYPDNVEEDVLLMLKGDPALFEVGPCEASTLLLSSLLTLDCPSAMSHEYQAPHMEIRRGLLSNASAAIL